MMPAGEYDTRFKWERHSYPAGNTFGDRRKRTAGHYAEQGYVWGALDEPSGGTTTQLESTQQDTRAVIRLRNLPAVGPLDRLTDLGHAEVWEVESTKRGANELVCQAVKR